MNPDKNSEISSASTDEENIASGSALAKREEAKQRLVSLVQLASWLNRDRNTITKWIDQGCPYVTKADRDRGISWEFDLSEVVRWREEQAASDAVKKFGNTEEGQMSEGEAKRRTAVAKAIVSMVEAAEVVASVLPKTYVTQRMSQEYSAVVATVSSIPDHIAGKVDPDIAVKVRKIADDQVRIALEKLKFADELSKQEA